MDANYLAVIGLPTNVGSIPKISDERFFFLGSSDELEVALRVAIRLDVRVGMDNGIPYVKSAKDLRKVTEHIVSCKLDGWENYKMFLD